MKSEGFAVIPRMPAELRERQVCVFKTVFDRHADPEIMVMGCQKGFIEVPHLLGNTAPDQRGQMPDKIIKKQAFE